MTDPRRAPRDVPRSEAVEFEQRVLEAVRKVLAPESALAIERYSSRRFEDVVLDGRYPETRTVVRYRDAAGTLQEETFEIWEDVANYKDPNEPLQVAMLIATNAAGL